MAISDSKTTLGEKLAAGRTLVAPGVYDAMSALLQIMTGSSSPQAG